MKLFKILLFVLLPIAGFSQIQGEDEVYLNGDRIDAKFGGGGIDNFTTFIKRNFDYSKVTKAGKLEGAFTIDEQGNVTKIKITQILDIESATEFIRVLKLCPKWEPAKRGGKPISIEIKYPMVFNERVKPNVRKTNEIESKNIEVDSISTLKQKESEANGTETKPGFNGGLQKFYNFINANFNTPNSEGFKGGKIIMSFVVEKDGSLTEIKTVKDIGYGCGEEAKRVLKMSPKWIPGYQKGKAVRCIYSIPINIQPNS